ncbi:MAG TPA: hypothetical protein VGK67_26650 [Myxococcales bacterium]|jgi:hypothetical protein
MGASWIGRLQKAVAKRLGKKGCPHLLACDSWVTVYLPRRMEPVTLEAAGGEAGAAVPSRP